MPVFLVLAFVAVPLLEIYVILQVGAAIGGWPTFWLLVADSVVGAWLLRVQGRRAWLEFRRALEESRWPGDEVVQGALVLVGGALLLTPGFVTDVVGLAMLVPPTRRLLAGALRRRAASLFGLGGVVGGERRRRRRRERPGAGSGLDVEVVEVQREVPPAEPAGQEGPPTVEDAPPPPDDDEPDDRGRT